VAWYDQFPPLKKVPEEFKKKGNKKMMQPWFTEAKLGIFIHWGIYAVKGIPESWSFFKGEISYEDYMAQCDGFTAKNYDPAAWAHLFAESGARYAVLTTKHHDGVALWDTSLSDLNVVEKTPATRDLIGPFCDALRRYHLKVGLYFSHLDWSHPDYASVIPSGWDIPVEKRNKYSHPLGEQDPAAWERFIKFHRGQLKELCVHYHPDLLWFDGDWERDDSQWRMDQLRDDLHRWQPGVLLNSRMRGYGDYKTPEQGIPIERPEGPWEFNMTINDSWGYQGHDTNHKSALQIIRIFCECIGMGGNLLLDIGPMADGTIPEPQVERLQALGKWIRKHEEAVYTIDAGLPMGHFYGPTALSKDRQTVYLYVFDIPRDSLALKGIRNNVKRVRVLGRAGELTNKKMGGAPWMNIPGVLYIDLPQEKLDSDVTVVAVDLEGPLDLYHGAGQVIEAN
jgi:alpha-L-fucosidase